MTAKQNNDLILRNATKAMRSAVRKVIADRKLRDQPVIVWKDGKVVRLKVDKLK